MLAGMSCAQCVPRFGRSRIGPACRSPDRARSAPGCGDRLGSVALAKAASGADRARRNDQTRSVAQGSVGIPGAVGASGLPMWARSGAPGHWWPPPWTLTNSSAHRFAQGAKRKRSTAVTGGFDGTASLSGLPARPQPLRLCQKRTVSGTDRTWPPTPRDGPRPTSPPSHGIKRSSVPLINSSGMPGPFGQSYPTGNAADTATQAEKRWGRSQASRSVNIPPLEAPTAKTRFGSMSCCAIRWSSSVSMKSISSG